MNILHIINRFFDKEATPSEIDMLSTWLEEDTSNQKEFNKAYDLFVLSSMAASEFAPGTSAKKSKLRRIAVITASLAASLFIGMCVNHFFYTRPAQAVIEGTILYSETMPGQRSSVVLSDGTKVELNSGSRIEYPAIFHKGERRIRLEGEAMLDVAHDAEHPFIVETFAYDIKVLGTKFDVIASREDNEFRTALLEGKIALLDKENNQAALLKPDMEARLEKGRLVLADMEDRSEYLWTDGIISASGISFDRLMSRFERCYGHKFVIDRDELPQIRYSYLKLRISDGVEHALDILSSGGSSFTYRYDESKDTYYIN